MPEQIAKWLGEYITANNIGSDDRLFPVCYSTVRSLIKRLGSNFHIKISPHDFRWHSATYASRNDVPLEIISKELMKHHDLKTTQVCLGKINDSEAIRDGCPAWEIATDDLYLAKIMLASRGIHENF